MIGSKAVLVPVFFFMFEFCDRHGEVDENEVLHDLRERLLAWTSS